MESCQPIKRRRRKKRLRRGRGRRRERRRRRRRRRREESEGLWNIQHSDHNNKTKRDSAMLKLIGELLRRNVAVESVEVL
jgi:hypothetical protein